MRKRSRSRSEIVNHLITLLAASTAVTVLAVCSADRDPGSGASPRQAASLASTASARSRGDTIQAIFPQVFRRLERPGRRLATLELPRTAAGAVQLTDTASGLTVAFSLEGAVAAARVLVGDVSLYPGAVPLDEGEARPLGEAADLLHRRHAAGTEDLVFFPRQPVREELRYEVDVRNVAGLRLVEQTLEFLDRDGAPRLRVAPPYVLDVQGRRAEAALVVEGCAVDTSPRAPWGRPVTDPGADSCAVRVIWADAGIRYPALVDPVWMSAGEMTTERTRHALALLPKSSVIEGDARPVLITGGFDSNGVPLASAEIYEPLSRTFAATGSMGQGMGRAAHTATPIPASLAGHVLIAGGATTSPAAGSPPTTPLAGPLSSTRIYDPLSGTFTAGPSMSSPRFHHTATALPDGRILLTGGIMDAVGQPTKTADLYSFNGGPGIIDPTAGQMALARSAHAAAPLGSDVLITGGIGAAGFALLSAEIFCASCPAPNTDTFVEVSATPNLPVQSQMTVARAFHTATTLSNGNVLVAGGINSIDAPITYASTAEIYQVGAVQGFRTTVAPMSVPRAYHTATLLAPPMVIPGASEPAEVLIAGGFSGTADLSTAEVYLPQSHSFHLLPALMEMETPRRHAAAILVNAGEFVKGGRAVLVTGGTSAQEAALSTAEIFLKDKGDPCSAAQECASGYCNYEGVCCDRECKEQCESCAIVGQEGTCGPAAAGKDLGWRCAPADEIEVRRECDGNGGDFIAEANDCKPNRCDSAGFRCSLSCPCSDAGFCEDAVGTPSECERRRNNGQSCTAEYECHSRNCVDGVCCDQPCTGQCEACDLPGKVGECSPVGSVGDDNVPHLDGGSMTLNVDGGDGGIIAREPCNGDGTACSGYCNGVQVDRCTYPGTNVSAGASTCADCQDEGCAEHSTQTDYFCSGDGGSVSSPNDCGGFRCVADSGTCRTSCAEDADCIVDFICQDGVCADLNVIGPACDGDHTLRVAGSGDPDCSPFRCPLGASACPTSCRSVEDCVSGKACNSAGQCVDAPPAPEVVNCSCSLPGDASDASSSSSSSSGFALLALGVTAAAARRRRPR